MKINREADYAIRIILYLAANDKHITARQIAKSVDITHSFALKILHRLNHAGHVTSVQGVAGGYWLGAPPSEISLLDIIEAIDGPVGINACLQPDNVCKRQELNVCPVHDTLKRINSIIRNEMGAVSIASLL